MRIDNPTFSPGGLNTVLTSSVASFSVSASQASTASFSVSASQASTASFSVSASQASTASFSSTSYKRYVNAYRSSIQFNVGTGVDIAWEVSQSTPDITVSGANVTLPAGTYHVVGNFVPNSYNDNVNGVLNLALVDSSNNVFSQVTQANPRPDANTSGASHNSGLIVGVITLTVTTTVKVRCVSAVGLAAIGTTGTRLTIVQI
jgi:hypothetical protein